MSLKEYSVKGKKIVVAGLTAALCLSAVAIATHNNKPVEAANGLLGDLNGDEKLNLPDASLSLRLALGLEKETEEYRAVGDVNFDGKLDLRDTTDILKGALGIIEIKNTTAPVPTISATAQATPTAPSKMTPVPKPTSSAQVVTRPPIETSIPLPYVEPGTPVTGTAINHVSDKDLNGAEYDSETGIYKFTKANADSKTGIQFNNPWKGNTSLRQTVEDALPSFMLNDKEEAVGLIAGDKLLTLDGTKTVIGTVEEKEGYIEVVPASASAAETDVLTGKAVKWSEGLLTTVNNIDTKVTYLPELAELYAKPAWTKGVSISFWYKYDWELKDQSDAAPILVIKNSSGCDSVEGGEFAKTGHTGDFAFMLRLNGGVRMEGDESGNCFRANNNIAGNNGEWNYYTVTFANDFITVYVNGQELVYNELILDKDDICYFNNGFLTRYSPVNQVKKEEVEDIRNYLKNGWTSVTGKPLDALDKEYCVIGNSRYKNPDAVTVKPNSKNLGYDLLIDMITKENTQIWFGAASETKCTAVHSVGGVNYNLQNDTQLANVNCYDSELTPEEVSANYEKEYAENQTKLGLKEK